MELKQNRTKKNYNNQNKINPLPCADPFKNITSRFQNTQEKAKANVHRGALPENSKKYVNQNKNVYNQTNNRSGIISKYLTQTKNDSPKIRRFSPGIKGFMKGKTPNESVEKLRISKQASIPFSEQATVIHENLDYLKINRVKINNRTQTLAMKNNQMI